MYPLKNWRISAVCTLATVTLVASLTWLGMIGLGNAQISPLGFSWTDGAYVTNGVLWGD